MLATTCWFIALRSYIYFYNLTPTTVIYTLSLHDALPISITIVSSMILSVVVALVLSPAITATLLKPPRHRVEGDRKSTRLNSSHANISYAVFCLKKKTTKCGRTHIRL